MITLTDIDARLKITLSQRIRQAIHKSFVAKKSQNFEFISFLFATRVIGLSAAKPMSFTLMQAAVVYIGAKFMGRRASQLLVLSASILALTAGSASASDQSNEQWEGFYLGVNAGVIDTNLAFRDGTEEVSPITGSGPNINDLTGQIGLQTGYNWQFDHVVLGLEGDLWWTDAGRSDIYNGTGNFMSGDTNFGGSVRGRLGLADQNAHIYVTGGWGYIDSDLLLSSLDGGALSPDETVQSSGFSAFVAGIGAEMKLTGNLSTRLEYLEYFLAEGAEGCADCGTDEVLFGGNASTLRLGLSYHFGDHAEPETDEETPATDIWSGFYAGVHAGFAETQLVTQDDYGDVIDAEGAPIFTNDLGPVGGIHAGYQRQIGSAVIGLEADYSFIEAGMDRGLGYQSGARPGSNYDLEAQIHGFGSLRGRLGLSAGNALVYATGGLGYVDYSVAGYDVNPFTGVRDPDFVFESADGFAVVGGVGSEVKITSNMSARFEYLFYQLREESTVCPDSVCDQPIYIDGNIHMARAGLTYLFNNNAPSLDDTYVADWNGAYIGGHADFLLSQLSVRDEDGNSNGEDPGASLFDENQTFSGGFFVGYNHQIGNAVFGIEADYTLARAGELQSPDGGDSLYDTNLNGFGSLRGRLGLASGEALFYTTAGIGYIDAESSLENPPNQAETRVENDGLFALVAGAGAEIQLTEDWSVRGEYLYYGFDEQEDTCVNCGASPSFFGGSLHTLRVGAAYRF